LNFRSRPYLPVAAFETGHYYFRNDVPKKRAEHPAPIAKSSTATDQHWSSRIPIDRKTRFCWQRGIVENLYSKENRNCQKTPINMINKRSFEGGGSGQEALTSLNGSAVLHSTAVPPAPTLALAA
jgi:hypothetical protein